MKVLVFIERSAPSRYWAAALPLLREKGVAASFASVRSAGPLNDALREAAVPETSFGAVTAKDYPAVTVALARMVRSERFDVIHACEAIPAALSGMSALLARPGVRLYHRQHNGCAQSTRLFHDLANRSSDVTMACSRATRAYACEVEGVEEARTMVAYNGVEPLREVQEDVRSGIRAELGIPPNAKVISIVARLSVEKGHLTLFDAARIVSRRTQGPLHVVVAGSGPYEGPLREAASRLVGPVVHFVGHQADVAPWMAVGDVFAAPSQVEAFGLAAAEAMSLGRPVVASAVGGLPEVVEDGVSGLLVPSGDPEAFASAVLRVFDSPELAAELGRNARARVQERFTLDAMVDGWIDCYRAVLGEGIRSDRRQLRSERIERAVRRA